MLELATSDVRVAIAPAIGGGLARFDWLGPAGPVPLFRPWDEVAAEPTRLACFPLVPWSGRISRHGIDAGGRFWALPANWTGERYPIHGDGWQHPWQVAASLSSKVTLRRASRIRPPFDYGADLTYELDGPTLTIRLAVEHRGSTPVPYGLGIHPYLPRTPGTLLQAEAGEVWLEGRDHLPRGTAPVPPPPAWDFSAARTLPADWINNPFGRWNGRARIAWPERQVQLDVAASPELSTCILYSPKGDADFFCFEPVSHPVDAFHLPGQPGLRVLGKGDRLEVACRFTASVLKG